MPWEARRSRRYSFEREVVVHSGAMYVCLGQGQWTGREQAALLAERFAAIDRLLERKAPPVIVSVTRHELRYLDLRDDLWKRVKLKSR